MSIGTSKIISEIIYSFLQSLQANVGIIPRSGYNCNSGSGVFCAVRKSKAIPVTGRGGPYMHRTEKPLLSKIYFVARLCIIVMHSHVGYVPFDGYVG
jgi:hypothetical protein